jgi:hydroxymethylpyrimidine pyrophosphatase-like HAD family hydrolase
MKNKVLLFDVDGTLTFSEKDKPISQLDYETFAFWPLLSSLFAKSPEDFRGAIKEWEIEMALIPAEERDSASFNMMERTIQHFLKKRITAEHIQKKAKEITFDFLNHGLIQTNALNYINACLRENIICVLTTGSYLDGLQGFVETLIQTRCLKYSPYLLLNGAVVDWKTKKLIKANVGAYKIENLKQTLEDMHITDYEIMATFGDDPYVNDKALLEMAPKNRAFVIKADKNKQGGFHPDFNHCSWDEFLNDHEKKLC